ncbi:MAG: YafY family transcriptional regulator [Micromonosporaceae bacterium]|nr:YafY family transcriptional regulator [Micromonosporaceae bacterium]
MPSPTSRVLELLELLQRRPLVTGRGIAEQLAVDRRTVRRDITTLQRLGIPVQGERGVAGGYRLRPGYRLPPLMLTEDEATVVVLGLAAVRRLGLGGSLGDSEAALAKVHRVLPDALRRRVEALDATLAFTTAPTEGKPPAGRTALLLADAIRQGRRVRVRYRSHTEPGSTGAESERELSPYGLVVHSGRWYLAAHDHGRAALRTFRADRIRRATLTGEPALAPPAGFDPLAHVSRSLAQVPWPHQVEVLLRLPLPEAVRRIPGTLADLAELDGGTVLRMRVTSLDWAASYLASLGCAFQVRQPEQLRAHVRALAARLAEA